MGAAEGTNEATRDKHVSTPHLSDADGRSDPKIIQDLQKLVELSINNHIVLLILKYHITSGT